MIFDTKKGLLVNGVSTKLKGVCLHQEAGCLGTAVTKEIWRDRLTHLKKLGCNAIRAAHHTYSEEFLDLCDEMGFMYMKNVLINGRADCMDATLTKTGNQMLKQW